MTDRNSLEPDVASWPRNGRALGLMIASLVAILLIGGALLAASQAGAASRWFGHRHGWSHGEHHDPERMREHAALAADWIARYVDASDEQRVRLEAIATDGIANVGALAEDHRGGREALIELLAQPVIDRDALEALRAETLELADRGSRLLAASLADAAEVLTPEQRAELIAFAERTRH